MRVFVLSVVASALLVSAAIAGDCCSQPACFDKSCGSCCGTGCKVVCEMKKVKKHVWVVQYEQICVANPGCKKSCCGYGADCSDGGCGDCGPCAELLSRPMVKPHCGKVRCRKKLIKKTIVCEVPTYKCIPISCGSTCGGCCDDHEYVAPKQERTAVRPAPLPPRMKGKA